MDKGNKRNLSDDDDDDFDSPATTHTSKKVNNNSNNNFQPQQKPPVPSKTTNFSIKSLLNNSSSHGNLSDSDSEISSPVQKKPSFNETTYKATSSASTGAGGDDKFKKMLNKMGFKDGQGLGKKGQGITKPIEDSEQKGRRGLGFKVKGFEGKVEEWDTSQDEININEPPEWLFNDYEAVPYIDILLEWIERSQKKMSLNDEDDFCSIDVLTKVLECKSVFDNLENRELINARSRSNPFEDIGSAIFQNRAAMKMANIDSVFNFLFTDPKDSEGRSRIEEDEPLYFCDVCAGPGGFSEYVLWRKRPIAKGFGFTLKGDNDFKLDDFIAGAPEFFEPFYGVGGIDGDGDVTKPDNLKEFERFVMSQTNNKGVHFVMADGGFSVEGNENIQEILSKQLYLCQFLCAISVLRDGGNFVCKLFDVFTPFSVGLIYLIYLCFERICLYKPVTSRPANSERYIICENMKGDYRRIIQEYMEKINEELWLTFRKNGGREDIRSIVPLEKLKENVVFYNYIKNSNEKIGQKQITNLQKIRAFATNQSLIDPRKYQIREDCLKAWDIPDKVRPKEKKHGKFKQQQQQHHNVTYDEILRKFDEELRNSKIKMDVSSMFNRNIKELNHNNLADSFKKSSLFDYRCMAAGGQLVLLLGCGRTNVYEYDFQGEKKWKKLTDFLIELPRETLLLAEKLQEYRGEDKGQRTSNVIHILDAFFINGSNLLINNDRIVSIVDRHTKLKIFEAAINKKSRSQLIPIRAKDLIRFEQLNSLFDNLIFKPPKSRNQNQNQNKFALHTPMSDTTEYYFYPNGVYIFKFVNSPWSVVWSKREQRKYFYNAETNKSSFTPPSDETFCANPKSYWENGYLWKWSADTNIDEQSQTEGKNALTKRHFLDFINQKLH